MRETLRHYCVQHQYDGAEEEQSEGVAKAPNRALLDGIAYRTTVRGQSRYRGHMVGLCGMMHADKKAQQK